MKQKKVFKIRKEFKGRTSFFEGTIEEMSRMFSRIGKGIPRTVDALIRQIERHVDYQYACCYDRPYYYHVQECE